MASLVRWSHVPVASPCRYLARISASWISRVRSASITCCPRVFLTARLELLPRVRAEADRVFHRLALEAVVLAVRLCDFLADGAAMSGRHMRSRHNSAAHRLR